MENLIGRTFHWLTVIDGPIKKPNSRKIYWKCRCQCGKETVVRGDGLKSGNTKSCGCWKNKIFTENAIKRQTLDLTNKRYGKLVALEKTELRKNERVVWKCLCDCGNICFFDTHTLQSGKVKSCGCLRSYGEQCIQNILVKKNIIFETQKSFDTCRFPDTKYLAKFDFYVDNKYLIEYDGEQHFHYKDNPYTWNSEANFKKVQFHDEVKNNWCKENNIPLIRIPYTHLENLKIEDLLLETSKFII